jgi:hypothetical protein
MLHVEKGFYKALSRGYKYVYIAIDIHDTIIPGNRTKNNDGKAFYPYAEEVLQNLSRNEKVKIILYSCSHPEPVREFTDWLKDHGIRVDYYNENPEHPSNELCDFSKKFFFDFMLDDKCGFVGETDWEILKNTLIKINQWV